MDEHGKYNDLCATCIYGDECVRRKRNGNPVYYCEEFEYSIDPPTKPFQKHVQNIGSELDSAEVNDERGNPIGLCVNCSVRKSCKHPRPMGGVWHCEDYE